MNGGKEWLALGVLVLRTRCGTEDCFVVPLYGPIVLYFFFLLPHSSAS